jgi:hypothetical protein
LKEHFYNSEVWKSDGPGRVAGGGGANLILFEGGGDGVKRCQKMKRKRRARLGSMGKKCDKTQRRGNVGRRPVALTHWTEK